MIGNDMHVLVDDYFCCHVKVFIRLSMEDILECVFYTVRW